MEEDVEDVSNGSAEVWDESLEAPFWHLLCKLKYDATKPLLLCITDRAHWYNSVYVIHNAVYEKISTP